MTNCYIMTGAQCRMARSLLKWSREKLADESKVGRGSIRAFEDDKSIRESNILDIQSVFDAFGVECSADGSVNSRTDGIKDFKGVGGCDRFFTNVEKMLKDKNTGLVCSIATQNMLSKSTGRNGLTNFERLENLSKVFQVRCLLSDQRIYLPATPSFEVRVYPEVPTTAFTSQFVYGEEVTVGFEQDPKFYHRHPSYTVLESPYHAKKLTDYFDKCWVDARPYATPLSKKSASKLSRKVLPPTLDIEAGQQVFC